MNVWAPFWTGIQACITSAWPEVFGPTHPIYRTAQVERFNWRAMIEAKDNKVAKWESPYVVVQVPPAPEVPGWGACNVVYHPKVTIYYISENVPPDMGAFLEGKLSALQDQLLLQNGNGFQLMYEIIVDASEQNPANQLLLTQNLPLFAGGLTFTAQIGFTV